jgi:hypothetical protein
MDGKSNGMTNKEPKFKLRPKTEEVFKPRKELGICLGPNKEFSLHFLVIPLYHIHGNRREANAAQIRASPRVCQILLGKSCVLPTSKKLCQVKKEFISNNLA